MRAWLGLLAAGALIVLVCGTYAWAGSTPVRLLTHVGGGRRLGWLGVGRHPETGLATARPVGDPSLVALVTAIPATIAAWRLGFSAEAWLGTTATLLALLLASRLAADDFYERRLAAVLVITPVALGGAYAVVVAAMWLQWIGIAGLSHGLPLRPGLNGLWLGAPNIVAALVLALAPQAMARLGRHRAAAGSLAVLAVFTVIASGTRGAFVGLAVTIPSSGRHSPSGTGGFGVRAHHHRRDLEKKKKKKEREREREKNKR